MEEGERGRKGDTDRQLMAQHQLKVAKLRQEELKNQSPHYFKDGLVEDFGFYLNSIY